MIERSTYSGLEWIGDVGGLYDGMSLIARIFIGPLTIFTLNSELLAAISGGNSHTKKVSSKDI